MESSKYARLKLLMEDDDLFIGRAPSHTTASHLATNIDVEMPAGVADTDTQASSVQDARNSVDGREAVVGIPEQASRSPTSMIETRDHQHPGDTNPQEPSPKAVGEAWSRIFVRGAVSTVPKDLGHLADPNETFCFFKVVRIYPYKFIKDELRETVSKNFFTDGKFWNEEWEIYYLYPPSDLEKKPFLLVPALQLQAFLDKINGQLGTELGLSPPSVAAEVVIRFENNNTRRPRFLGISTSHSSYQDLTNAIPAKTFRPLGEPLLWPKPSETDLEAWEETLKLAHRTVAGKGTHKNKKKTKKKKGAGKMDAQQGGKQLEQTQQYLGLRQLIEQDEQAPVLVRALALPPLALNLSAPFPPHDAVVFVSIDIETYERNHSLITEIGIASLDTLDLARLPPGDNGTNWISKIRARHFRVQEHGHLHNTDFVQGCPDRFEFGESEWVSIVSAESIIASYIRSLCTIPESGETSTPRRFAEAVLGCVTEAQGLRNVVILGHSIDGDIATLKELGFDVQTLEFLEGTFDVAIMDRYMRGDTQKRSLGSILHDLGLTGWYLHNAGNDAVYALQVLLGLALRYDGREGKGKGEEGEAQEADRQVTDKKDGQATAKEDVDAHRKAKAEAKQEDDDEKEIVFKGRQSRGDKEVVKGKQNEEQQGIDEVEGGFEKDDEGKDKLVGKSEAGDDVKEGSQGDKLQTKVKVEEEQVDDKAKEGHKGEDEVNKKEPVKIKVEGEPKIEKQTEGGQAEVKEEKEGGDKVKEEVKKEGKTDEEAPKQATKATTEPTTAGPTALPPAAETPAAAATEQAADDSSSISSGSDGGVALPPGYWDSPAAQQTHILFAPSDLREDDLDDKDDSDSD